jgi:large subunit ribosomal protein L22
MRTLARARFVRVSARKARLVLDQIRGKSVGEALATLQYTPRAAARLVEKVLRSAIANAEHNHQVRNLDDLRVVHAVADGGPSMKRVQPRAMGRAFFIRHRSSHLTIGVSDETNGAARPVPPPREGAPAARQAGPAGAPAASGAAAATKERAAARPKTAAAAKGGEKAKRPKSKEKR